MLCIVYMALKSNHFKLLEKDNNCQWINLFFIFCEIGFWVVTQFLTSYSTLVNLHTIVSTFTLTYIKFSVIRAAGIYVVYLPNEVCDTNTLDICPLMWCRRLLSRVLVFGRSDGCLVLNKVGNQLSRGPFFTSNTFENNWEWEIVLRVKWRALESISVQWKLRW